MCIRDRHRRQTRAVAAGAGLGCRRRGGTRALHGDDRALAGFSADHVVSRGFLAALEKAKGVKTDDHDQRHSHEPSDNTLHNGLHWVGYEGITRWAGFGSNQAQGCRRSYGGLRLRAFGFTNRRATGLSELCPIRDHPCHGKIGHHAAKRVPLLFAGPGLRPG